MIFLLGGIRTSTVAALLAFTLVAIYRNETRPLVYAWVWLAGFEATFQVTSFAFDRLPVGPDGPLFFIVLGLLTVPWLTRRGVRPSLPLIAAAAAVWVVWVATGFHVNGHAMLNLNPSAEVFNESAKTLWAAAYLWPLRGRRSLSLERKPA